MASQKVATYGVVAPFCSFGILRVWPHSQKYTTPCISQFLLSHLVAFGEILKLICPCRFASRYFPLPILVNPLKTIL